MSAVIAVPELMAQAATDLAAIGDTLNAAHLTAAVPTVAVLPAAADEVSASIAHLMSDYGQEYQKLAREAAAFSDHFARTLKSGGAAYAATEATSAASLRPLAAPAANDPFAGVLSLLSETVGNLFSNTVFFLGFLGIAALTIFFSGLVAAVLLLGTLPIPGVQISGYLSFS